MGLAAVGSGGASPPALPRPPLHTHTRTRHTHTHAHTHTCSCSLPQARDEGKTRPHIILRNLTTQPGQVFSLHQGRRDIDAVYSMGLFEDVSMRPQPSEGSSLEHPKVGGVVWWGAVGCGVEMGDGVGWWGGVGWGVEMGGGVGGKGERMAGAAVPGVAWRGWRSISGAVRSHRLADRLGGGRVGSSPLPHACHPPAPHAVPPPLMPSSLRAPHHHHHQHTHTHTHTHTGGPVSGGDGAQDGRPVCGRRHLCHGRRH